MRIRPHGNEMPIQCREIQVIELVLPKVIVRAAWKTKRRDIELKVRSGNKADSRSYKNKANANQPQRSDHKQFYAK